MSLFDVDYYANIDIFFRYISLHFSRLQKHNKSSFSQTSQIIIHVSDLYFGPELQEEKPCTIFKKPFKSPENCIFGSLFATHKKLGFNYLLKLTLCWTFHTSGRGTKTRMPHGGLGGRNKHLAECVVTNLGELSGRSHALCHPTRNVASITAYFGTHSMVCKQKW